MQFLLGVDAPVSLRARCARSSRRSLLNALLALPVYALVRRWLLPRSARGPAPPPPPRLHDRRAVPALARMSLRPMLQLRGPPPADHARSSRCASRSSAASRSRCSRSSSSASGSCRCCRATSTSREAHDNRVRDVRVQAPRGDDRRPQRAELVDNRLADVVQLDPRRCPPSSATPRSSGARRWASARRPKGKQGRAVPIPPSPTPALRRASQRSAACSACGRDDPASASCSSSRRALREHHACAADVPQPVRNYLLERQERFPGVDVEQVYLRPYPHERARRAALRHGRRDQPRGAQGAERYRGVKQGTIVGKERPRVHLRPLPARPATAPRASRSTPSGGPKGNAAPSASRVPGKQLRAVARPRPAAAPASRRCRGGRDPTRREPAAARSWRMDPRNGEVLAMGSYPSFDPNVFAKPITQRALRRS